MTGIYVEGEHRAHSPPLPTVAGLARKGVYVGGISFVRNLLLLGRVSSLHTSSGHQVG